MGISNMLKTVTKLVGIVALSATLVSPTLMAAEGKKEKRKTQVFSKSVGQKVQKAFEAYGEDRIADAITLLEDIKAKQDFDKASVARLLGSMYAGQKGRADDAIKQLKLAVDLDALNANEHEQSIKLLADLNLQEANYAEALKGYKQWMDFTGNEDSTVYLRMAQANYQLKKLPEIIPLADKAIELQKKPNTGPYLMKVTSYYERKMYRKAAETASVLVKLFPSDKRWWVQLAQFYLLDENYEKALSSFELAYKQGFLEKENEYSALGQLYAAYGIPYKAAVFMEKYMKEGKIKQTEKVLANLANYFHQAQNFKHAAKYYSKLGELTKNPSHYKRVGELLLMSEDYAKAIKAFDKSIELGSKKADSIRMSLIEAHFYRGSYKLAYQNAKEAAKNKKFARSAKGWISYIKDTAQRKNVKI